MKRLNTQRSCGIALLVAAAFSPERLHAQEIPIIAAAPRPLPARAVVRQPNGRNLVRHNGGWLMLPEWLTVELPAADDPEIEDADADGTRWHARISDAGFDRSLFGTFPDAAAARQDLLARLVEDVDDLTGKYRLTAAQKQKLQLAGRGDIKRMFDRIEDSRRRLQAQVVQDIEGVQRLCVQMSQESSALRAGFRKGPFGEGSLFAKTLKSALTAEQIAGYEKRKRDHPVAVTHSWDLRVR